MAVIIEFAPTAFTTGPLASMADQRHRAVWVLQSGVESSPHIDCNGPHGGAPNSISITVRGNEPSWLDSVIEFNLLPLAEIRSQLANAVERGILQVRDADGNVVAPDIIRGNDLRGLLYDAATTPSVSADLDINIS